jgi:hypothetical protein
MPAPQIDLGEKQSNDQANFIKTQTILAPILKTLKIQAENA